MSPGTQNSRAEGSRKRRQVGVLVTLASKSARRLHIAALGALEVDDRELGRVQEDGDVAWHTAAARKVRGNVVKGGVLIALSSKGARRFPTTALGVPEINQAPTYG